MNLEDQLFRYFGTADFSALTPDVLAAGLEHMRVDFGLEQDRGRRFALWSLMYVLGDAPDLDAFESEEERNAARNFMDLAAGAGEGA